MRPDDAAAIMRRLTPMLLLDVLDDVGETVDSGTGYAMGMARGTGTANLGVVGLYNPPNTGVRLRLREAWLSGFTAQAAVQGGLIGTAPAIPTNSGVRQWRDGKTTGLPQGEVRYDDLASLGLNTNDFKISNVDTLVVRPDVIVPPGWVYDFQEQVTGRILVVTFFWEEFREPA